MTKCTRFYNHDLDPAMSYSCPSPSVVATIGTVALGAGVWYLGNHFRVASKLANDKESTIEKINDPDTKSRLMESVLISRIEMLRDNVVNTIDFSDSECDENIKKWAHRNRFNEFAYNKKSEEVYELIMAITGYMIMVVQLDGNIPDYLHPRKNKYFSALTLAADLIAWYIMEATISDASPFMTDDDSMTDEDTKYLDRTKQELQGFLDAFISNCKNTSNSGRSHVILFLEKNDFINVNPLHKMKEALTIHQASDFLHEVNSDEEKYTIGDVPWSLLENFRKRMKKNLEEPCLMAKKYARRKEILKTAEDIKELIQILNEAGRMVVS